MPVVQAATQVNVSASSTTAPTISITVTGGNCIIPVAHIGDFGGTSLSLTNITDGGNAYTARTAQHTDANERTISIIGYSPNATGGARTVTFNLANTSGGANRYYVLGCLEALGLDTSPQDATASNNDINTSGATDISAGPITTTDVNVLIVGVAGDGGGADTNLNFASPAGWTNRYRQNDVTLYYGMDCGTWEPGTIQTAYTAQWSHDNNANDEGCGVIVAFKPASGGYYTPVRIASGFVGPMALRARYKPERVLPWTVGGSASTAYTITADSGTYNLTGTSAVLRFNRVLAALAGSYIVTGTVATLKFALKIQALAGSYTLSGTAASLVAARKLIASAGSYVITGTTAGLKFGRVLSAGSGTYVLSGTDVTLTHGVGYRLTADAGSYAIVGSTVVLYLPRKLSASSGAYTLTGTDANFQYTQVSGATGNFIIFKRRRRRAS